MVSLMQICIRLSFAKRNLIAHHMASMKIDREIMRMIVQAYALYERQLAGYFWNFSTVALSSSSSSMNTIPNSLMHLECLMIIELSDSIQDNQATAQFIGQAISSNMYSGALDHSQMYDILFILVSHFGR